MIFPTSWNRARVCEVFTTESRQKARDLFLRTHLPFQRIRIDFCKEQGAAGTFVTEDQVRAIIQNGNLHADNRLFFVVGEAGSGKSELCQWLEYSVDTSRSLPIHIPRSMTTAAHVVTLLRQKLGEVSPAALHRVPLTTQSDFVALCAVVLLYEQASETLTPVDRWAALVGGDELRHTLSTYLAATATGAFVPMPLTDDASVQELCQRYGIVITPEEHAATTCHLGRIIARALEQALWLGDLRTLLSALSERVVQQGRRPLLLLEDATAFQLFGDRLLDYLLDLTSGHFDAVIGVTTGFERTQLAGASLADDLTHIHHRLRARFVLTDEHGRSYGLEDTLIDLARTYLSAVQNAAPHDVEHVVFDKDLYPFTETALRRAFASLHEEGNPRQTPRLFLEHVLAASLMSDDPPPLSFDQSTYLNPPPTLFRRDEAPDPQLQSLLRWYGEIGKAAITLDARIAQRWGVTPPDSLLVGNTIRVSRAYISEPPEATVNPDWQQELRELQAWLTEGGLYPSRETLKRGIERVLLHLGDPRSLGSPNSLSVTGAQIYYARGDEHLPISLGHGSGDQPSSPASVKIQITNLPEERGMLEEIAYLALSGGELAQVCGNLALTLDWAQRHWDAYNKEVRLLLAQRAGGVTVEHLIWVYWRLVSGLCGTPWNERPHLQPWHYNREAYSDVSPWSLQQHAACYSTGEALLRHHETVRRLFIGTFTLRDTLLDRERCEATGSAASDVGVIDRLARLSLASLRTLPYRIRPLGQTLYDVLAPLQRYAFALTQLDTRAALRFDLTDLTRREQHLGAQLHLDHEELRQQLLTLRWRCGEVGVTWKESWDAPIEVLRAITREQIAALFADVQRVQAAAEREVADDSYNMWSYQAIRHQLRPVLQHPYWHATTVLRTIQKELITVARVRYRRGGGLVTGTRPYRQLIGTTRTIWKELNDG